MFTAACLVGVLLTVTLAAFEREAAADESLRSELRVVLAVKNGKPIVDRRQSGFAQPDPDNPSSTAPDPNPTATFARLLRIPLAQALTSMFDDLDRVFGGLPPLAQHALAHAAQADAVGLGDVQRS